MNDDLDPKIQILFANSNQDLANDGFAEQVMAKANKNRRVRMASWTGIGLAVVLLAWLTAAPMQDMTFLISRELTTSLVQQSDGWLLQILAPVNSVAGLLALCLLGLQAVLRWVWS